MKHLNLLLADDDDDDRLFFEEAVAEITQEIALVHKRDGEEILNYLSHPQVILPDIIFLDLNMPFIDGLKCLEEIRKQEAFDELFVVIFTTTASPREIDLVFEKGANLFLIKPNSFDQLKKSIEAIISLDLTTLIRSRRRDRFVFNLDHFGKS